MLQNFLYSLWERTLFSTKSKEKCVKKGGFTLVELLVVLAILSLLTGLVATQAIGYLDSSRVTTTKTQISNLVTALDLYKLDTGSYPSEEQGLDVLVVPPENATNWNGPYLASSSVPTDPWGETYIYKLNGSNAFSITSFGADKAPGGNESDADISN